MTFNQSMKPTIPLRSNSSAIPSTACRGLSPAGLLTRELDSLPGSDVRKVALANLLLQRTVARQSWIADKLAMRSAANVSQQVRRYPTQRPRLASAFREYLESVNLSRFVD